MPTIEITSNSDALINSLTDSKPQGISISSRLHVRNIGGIEDIVTAIITIDAATIKAVAASLLAAWLYDKLKKHKANKVTINRKEIELTEGNITKVIEETIEIKK